MKTIQKPDPYEFKKILSLIRDADFAHPGEEEAIKIAFQNIPRSPNHKSLDVGCGLGGTAEIVQRQGYGEVTGVDISPDNIQYARRKYPEISFLQSNVSDISINIKNKFELIYLFNSFCFFPDHAKALTELRKVAMNNANLILFDYADPGNYDQNRPEAIYNNLSNPIKIKKISELMEQAGWIISQQKDLTEDYERWYKDFVEKIKSKQKQIVAASSEETYEYIYNSFMHILRSIENRHLGGTLIVACMQKGSSLELSGLTSYS